MPTLTTINYESPAWIEIPRDHRNEIRLLVESFAQAPSKGITNWLKREAARFGMSYSALRDKFYALKESGDWTVLIDARKAKPAKTCRTAQPRFIAFLLRLVEENKRKNVPAFRELRRLWLNRDQAIPGYEDWPAWPRIPAGWSNRNLADIVARELPKAVRQSIRVGTSSKTNTFLPTTLNTRVGLWPGAVIQLDDQWHDNWVTIGTGRKLQLCRVLELGALDLFSAHRFHWGAKPRRRRDDGTMENIGGRDARLFVAALVHLYGHSPQGTMIMVEHETMSISEDVERLLYDASHGMLRVDRQPIEGKQAALTGFWPGSEGGNFRAKACLESTHALIRNDLGRLPMQTGSYSSGIQAPVVTDRQVAYIAKVMRDVIKHAPHRAELLRLPTIDFYRQFEPFLRDYYHFGLAMRTDHSLEGWKRLGHQVIEYTTLPGSDQYLSEDAFLALADTTRQIIAAEAQRQPEQWTRRRNLAPLEVWNRRAPMKPLGFPVIAEILTDDLAREVRAARGFLTFQDDEFAPEELVYESRFISGPRRGHEIGHGEKVRMFANPFNDATAICVDAQGRPLGEVPLYQRNLPIDPDAFGTGVPFESRPDIRSQALKEAAGHKHERIADILAPVRIRHAGTVQAARDLREHNARVIDASTPFTAEEVAADQVAKRTTRRAQAAGDMADEAIESILRSAESRHTDDLGF